MDAVQGGIVGLRGKVRQQPVCSWLPPLFAHLLVFVFQLLEVRLGFYVFLLHFLQLQSFCLHYLILACHLQQGLHLKKDEERGLSQPCEEGIGAISNPFRFNINSA